MSPDATPGGRERRRRGPTLDGLRASAERHPRWFEWITRLGYGAKGVLYLVVGGTGLLAALGIADRARGSSGAIRVLATLPMGRYLLGALAVGLAGYAILSIVAAVRAPEGERGAHGLALRAADALSGVVYAGLTTVAIRLLADPIADPATASMFWTRSVLALPAGAALLGVAGVVTISAAAYLMFKAFALPIATRLDRRAMGPTLARVIALTARVGAAARAALFAVCGWLLLGAARAREPRAAVGVGDALNALADTVAGAWLVGGAALGCVAYGLYQLAKARYRRLTLTRR